MRRSLKAIGILLLCAILAPPAAGRLGANRALVAGLDGRGALAYVGLSIASAVVIVADLRRRHRGADGFAWALLAIVMCIAAVPMYLAWTRWQDAD